MEENQVEHQETNIEANPNSAEPTNTDASENVEDKEKKCDNSETSDPHAYLNRGGYSSERYKLEIKNLPKYFGFGQLRKLLKSLNLKYVKITAPEKSTYAFVTFVDEDAKTEASKIINAYQFKGKALVAIPAKPAPDPMSVIRKRKNEENGSNSEVKNKKSDADENLTADEKVQNSTTPLWKLTYDEQLIKKRNEVKRILVKITDKIGYVNYSLDPWINQQKKLNDSICCEFVDYLPSPVPDNYRNKCEFSIGYDLTETNQVVGFRLGEYKAGSSEVCAAYACKNIAECVKDFVKCFQEYLNTTSSYKAFNVKTHNGNWRQLTVRNNLKNEILAIAVFDKKDLTDDEINVEKQNLVKYFDAVQSEHFKLVSFLFNLNLVSSGTSRMNNLETLIGTNCLYESLFDLNFRISPLAFFQANTKGAEVLYRKIGEISEIDQNTVVLDICCGTGTIGLTLARNAKKVIGIEIIQQAIDDAKLNSQLNNITNVEFICGKAEDTLKNIIRQFESEKVIAIVDPPRAGLHSTVIQTLRRLENLDTIIYVSCNAELALNNFIDFARPESNTYRHQPFVPIKAIGVDMFPHTAHYELVLLLKRYKPSFINKEPA